MIPLIKYYSRATMQAKPYADTDEIETIDTGLGKQWRYSPLFKKPFAETYIGLTGSRIKDYRLAEANTGQKHIPGTTVWHHVWAKDNQGNYRMQLVTTVAHQKTCPHAGGCKLWSIEHNKIYKAYGTIYVSETLHGKVIAGKVIHKTGLVRTGVNLLPYNDYVIDFIFDDKSRPNIQMMFNKHYLRRRKSRPSKIWGLDPYGNLFLSSADGQLFFWNHETKDIFALSVNEGNILI